MTPLSNSTPTSQIHSYEINLTNNNNDAQIAPSSPFTFFERMEFTPLEALESPVLHLQVQKVTQAFTTLHIYQPHFQALALFPEDVYRFLPEVFIRGMLSYFVQAGTNLSSFKIYKCKKIDFTEDQLNGVSAKLINEMTTIFMDSQERNLKNIKHEFVIFYHLQRHFKGLLKSPLTDFLQRYLQNKQNYPLLFFALASLSSYSFFSDELKKRFIPQVVSFDSDIQNRSLVHYYLKYRNPSLNAGEAVNLLYQGAHLLIPYKTSPNKEIELLNSYYKFLQASNQNSPLPSSSVSFDDPTNKIYCFFAQYLNISIASDDIFYLRRNVSAFYQEIQSPRTEIIFLMELREQTLGTDQVFITKKDIIKKLASKFKISIDDDAVEILLNAKELFFPNELETNILLNYRQETGSSQITKSNLLHYLLAFAQIFFTESLEVRIQEEASRLFPAVSSPQKEFYLLEHLKRTSQTSPLILKTNEEFQSLLLRTLTSTSQQVT